MDHHPIWYRLAAENKPGQFYYYVPVDELNKGAWPLTCRSGFLSPAMITYNIMVMLLRICTAVSIITSSVFNHIFDLTSRFKLQDLHEMTRVCYFLQTRKY